MLEQEFLSTPSARRATKAITFSPLPSEISIHALREEGDATLPTPCRLCSHFYPRPPRGGRPRVPIYVRLGGAISIHALREEGDIKDIRQALLAFLFLSTPSARRATAPGRTAHAA